MFRSSGPTLLALLVSLLAAGCAPSEEEATEATDSDLTQAHQPFLVCGVAARTQEKSFASFHVKKGTAGSYHHGFVANGAGWDVEIETTKKGVALVAVFKNGRAFGEIADTYASFNEQMRYRDPASAPPPDPLDPSRPVGHFLLETTGVSFFLSCGEFDQANVSKLTASTFLPAPNGGASAPPPPAPPPPPPFP